MKSLPPVDLRELYAHFYTLSKQGYAIENRDQVVGNFYHTDNPVIFKESLLQLIQLFVTHETVCFWSPEALRCPETLRSVRQSSFFALCNIGKEVVGSFYSGIPIDFSAARKSFGLIEYTISFNSCMGDPQSYRLSDYPSLIHGFGMSIHASDSADIIAYVAQGGLEPALLAAFVLEVQTIVPIHYSGRHPPSNTAILPTFVRDSFRTLCEGKSLLVIDDVVGRGTTQKEVLPVLQSFSPTSIRFRSAARAMGSLLLPDY